MFFITYGFKKLKPFILLIESCAVNNKNNCYKKTIILLKLLFQKLKNESIKHYRRNKYDPLFTG